MNNRPALTAHDVEQRVAELLRADATCKGQVDKRTIRAIAEVVAYPQPVIDGDVAAERAGCRKLIDNLIGEFDAWLEGDPEGEGLITAYEARRVRTVAVAQREMLDQGLHR